MSKGSRETRTLEYFEQCENLVVARAILRACTETLERRERAARGGGPKPQRKRWMRPNSVQQPDADQLASVGS